MICSKFFHHQFYSILLVRLLVVLPIFFVSLNAFSEENSAQLPPDAAQYLQGLPEQAITVDFLVARSIQTSDAFRAIKSDLLKLDAPLLQSQAPLETTLNAGATRLIDKNESSGQLGPGASFSPNKSDVMSYTLGVETYFRTGTAVEAEIEHTSSEINYPNSTFVSENPSIFYETSGKISLIQNLWKDGFGIGTRLGLEAGENQRDAAQETYDESVENFVLDLVDQHYTSWTLQSRVRAALAGVERRKRLLKITRIKLKRGTSERPDLLQVESALINSEVQLSEAKQALGEIWRNLVVKLRFPIHWMDIDPLYVPVRLDSPVQTALETCGPETSLKAPPTSTTETRKLEKQAKAAELLARKAENSFHPTTQIFATLDSNGLDRSRSPTFSEAVGTENPAWTIGLTFSMPLSRVAERAERSTARADRDRLDALHTRSKNDLRALWVNRCNELHRLNRVTQNLEKAFEKQSLRRDLEEKRFRLARVTPLAVIQAGDDATEAELKLRDSQTQLRKSAWEVQRLQKGLRPYVDQLVSDSSKSAYFQDFSPDRAVSGQDGT